LLFCIIFNKKLTPTLPILIWTKFILRTINFSFKNVFNCGILKSKRKLQGGHNEKSSGIDGCVGGDITIFLVQSKR
ncbi:hypothetical protein KQJ29_38620, partial [Enterococcus sp. S181_ASV_20]|nr:hypothetical protein [Enterococcus sp. S181_ASV_20]